MRVRLRDADHAGALTLTVCVNVRTETVVPCCGKRGGIELATAVRSAVSERKLPITVQTIQCLGLCAKGPNARLAPSNSWFHDVALDDVPALIEFLAAQAAKPVPFNPVPSSYKENA